MLELFATGDYTLTGIQKEMFALGLNGKDGRPLHLNSVTKILMNPFYCGMFRYRGELHQGSHKPMISKPLFDRIQKVLKDNGKPRKNGQRKEFVFLGFARCGGAVFRSPPKNIPRRVVDSTYIIAAPRRAKPKNVNRTRFCGKNRLPPK